MCRDFFVKDTAPMKSFEKFKTSLRHVSFYGLADNSSMMRKRSDLTVEYLRNILRQNSIEELENILNVNKKKVQEEKAAAEKRREQILLDARR